MTIEPSDPKIEFRPKLIKGNFWLTYAIIPALLTITLSIQLCVDLFRDHHDDDGPSIPGTCDDASDHKQVKALLLFMLLVKIGSLIWFSVYLHPRFKKFFELWQEKAD